MRVRSASELPNKERTEDISKIHFTTRSMDGKEKEKALAFTSSIGLSKFHERKWSSVRGRCRRGLQNAITSNITTTAAAAISKGVSTSLLMELKIGDRVRVLDKGIVMYHFPGKRNEPVEVSGMTGTVIKDISMLDGTKMSATAPYVVKLDEYPRSQTHFAEDEVEVIGREEPQSETETEPEPKSKPEPESKAS